MENREIINTNVKQNSLVPIQNLIIEDFENIDINKIKKYEVEKSISDISYFINNYCYIKHPIRGIIKFETYKYQDKILEQFINHSWNLIKKSRQLGISTIISAYVAWKMLFFESYEVVIIANKASVAKGIINKIKLIYEKIPKWFFKYIGIEVDSDNKFEIRLSNKSGVVAMASTEDAGRSIAGSLVIWDEMAFTRSENLAKKIWDSITSVLATGGDFICLSTPNGVGDIFYKEWYKALNGENGFNPIELSWKLHPERNQEWRDAQTKKLGERTARQECLSGDSIITVQNTITNEIFEISLREFYENLLIDKIYSINEYKILNETGFKLFNGIQKIIKQEYFEFQLEYGIIIKCSYEHKFILENNTKIYAYNLNINDYLIHKKYGKIKIINIIYHKHPIELYDIINVENTHSFYANDILSSNCDGDFLSGGSSVIAQDILSWYENNLVIPPIEKRHGNKLWIFKEPEYGETYIINCDVGRGDGSDKSSFQVLNRRTYEQAAEYDGKIPTTPYSLHIFQTALEYNNALVVIENNSIGWAVINNLLEYRYNNLFYSVKGNNVYLLTDPDKILDAYSDTDKLTPGFTNHSTSRALAVDALDEAVRNKKLKIYSSRTINELKTFIWKTNGRAEHMDGEHDDLIIPLAFGILINEFMLKLEKLGINYSSDLLSNYNETINEEYVDIQMSNKRNNSYDSVIDENTHAINTDKLLNNFEYWSRLK